MTQAELHREVAPALGATLLRLYATGPAWIDRLPPVPVGNVVTVTVSEPSLRQVPPQRLLETGYRIVGQHPTTAGPGTVDLLIQAELAAGFPGYLQAALAVADRAYDLRMGPVQAVLGAEVAIHLGLT